MPDGFSIASLAMQNDLQRANLISHNLANANTPGYLRQQPSGSSFADLLASGVMSSPQSSGVSVTDMRPGLPRHTGGKLDLAIQGDGFFEVLRDGQRFYTRAGSFQLDHAGRLAMASGETLQGQGGDIRLTGGEPVIDQHGKVHEDGSQVAQLRIVHFTHPQHLQREAGGLFSIGTAAINPDGRSQVLQQHLASSNVNTAAEMISLLETVRHFESGQKLIQIFDAMHEKTLTRLGEF